jgi:hypothetical protein
MSELNIKTSSSLRPNSLMVNRVHTSDLWLIEDIYTSQMSIMHYTVIGSLAITCVLIAFEACT